MQFSKAIILAFAAAVSAAAVENASPVENFANRAEAAPPAYSGVGNCKPASYRCGTITHNGKVVCKSCAILVGNSGGKCTVNNICRKANNSCKVQDGRPFCV